VKPLPYVYRVLLTAIHLMRSGVVNANLVRGELQAAHDASQLPELASDETRKALNDLLIRVRLSQR